jgi:hypothetical protein
VFASLLIAQPDADPTRVSRQMGHANANITYSIYAHLFEQAKYAESARAALDASFGSSGEDLDVARAGAVAGAAAMSRRTTLPFSAGSTPAVQRWQEGSC